MHEANLSFEQTKRREITEQMLRTGPSSKRPTMPFLRLPTWANLWTRQVSYIVREGRVSERPFLQLATRWTKKTAHQTRQDRNFFQNTIILKSNNDLIRYFKLNKMKTYYRLRVWNILRLIKSHINWSFFFFKKNWKYVVLSFWRAICFVLATASHF